MSYPAVSLPDRVEQTEDAWLVELRVGEEEEDTIVLIGQPKHFKALAAGLALASLQITEAECRRTLGSGL